MTEAAHKPIFLFLFNAEEWLALGTWALVLATIFLFLAAWRQIREIRDENRKAATLAACGQYDLNDNINDAIKTLWAAKESKELEKNPRQFRPQISLILNHLDAIAIGIEQGVYIESLAWDHLEHIVPDAVELYIDSKLINAFGLKRATIAGCAIFAINGSEPNRASVMVRNGGAGLGDKNASASLLAVSVSPRQKPLSKLLFVSDLS
jgi:hypothetical protein